MWLKIGDRVRNRSGWTGVVLEVNETNAKVELITVSRPAGSVEART